MEYDRALQQHSNWPMRFHSIRFDSIRSHVSSLVNLFLLTLMDRLHALIAPFFLFFFSFLDAEPALARGSTGVVAVGHGKLLFESASRTSEGTRERSRERATERKRK